MGILTKIDQSWQAVKAVFGSEAVPPLYARLNNGDHTYNYETTRFGFLGALGLGDSYYTPKENLKWYYEHIGFLADCVNLYADIAAQVQIQEIDEKGNVVENSEWVKLLDQPNAWQDGISFIKEYVINVLTTGINITYGNFFRNGNLKINADLYNIDFYNIAFPKVKNRYTMRRSDIQELTFKEYLDDGDTRSLKMYELAFVYDQIPKATYGGEKGYKADKFLNPVSRLSGIMRDMHAIINTSDNMLFLSHRRANFVISKKANNGTLAPLASNEKADIETKLSNYRKNDIVATNEDLQALNLQRKVKDFHLIEIQNNAKENIRSRFGIPRDLLDAYTGTNSGSTYENQQFAEARFVLNNVKNITDSFLYSIESKNPKYFAETGRKLIGKYDHMASVQAVNTKLKNAGFQAKADALMSFLNAYEKTHSLDLDLNYEEFLRNYGFEEFLKYQSTQ